MDPFTAHLSASSSSPTACVDSRRVGTPTGTPRQVRRASVHGDLHIHRSSVRGHWAVTEAALDAWVMGLPERAPSATPAVDLFQGSPAVASPPDLR